MMCTRRDGVDPRQYLRGRFVMQMAEAAADSLLQRTGIVAVLEHIEIVIALQNQRVATGEASFHVGRRHAEVRQHAQTVRAVADDVLHRLARVVRNGYRLDFQRADRESVMAVETVDAGHALEPFRYRGQRAERRPHRNAMPCGERRDAADMIGVLVRDENRGERRGRESEPGEASRRAANAEPAIDQDARAARFDDEAVAFAAAAQGGEAHARCAAT